MNNLLLIGKPNEDLVSLNEALADCYNVQYASENPSALAGVLKLAKPDVAVVLLVGLTEGYEAIFTMLDTSLPKVPVIMIGTMEEHMQFERFEREERYGILMRPFKNRDILDMVKKTIEEYSLMGKKRILVVDDDGLQLRNIKSILEDTYEISLANSGLKALTSMGKNRPDLILLDYEMPVCNGKKTLEMIRAEKEYDDIPVVFLTGLSSEAHIRSVLDLKPAGYLLKPPEPKVLHERLAEILSKAKENDDDEE